MSWLLGVLLGAVALFLAVTQWKKVPRDPVGVPLRARRQGLGLQERFTEWLSWDAPLAPPDPSVVHDPSANLTRRPADRALVAAVRTRAAHDACSPEEAYQRLRDTDLSPAARHFLAGKMRAATRAHWRSRFTGAPWLFLPWFHLILVVRRGRRFLYLETLAAVTEELQHHE